MEYLPTLTPKVIQNNPNVGKYSIHGSLGIGLHTSQLGLESCRMSMFHQELSKLAEQF